MALDIYVMPIWKFKAGDFSSPLEQFDPNVVTVGLDGSIRQDPRSRAGFWKRWQAKRATRQLQREIEAEIGHTVKWNDDGEVAYARQGYGFESVRAFAKWLDCRAQLPTFDPPPERNYYNHPAVGIKLSVPLTFPQLVEHSCHSGYFIPAELERVVGVEPFTMFGTFNFKRSVGSGWRLLRELRQLSEILGVDESYTWVETDPLAEVKERFAILYKVTKLAAERNLPIVFHG